MSTPLAAGLSAALATRENEPTGATVTGARAAPRAVSCDDADLAKFIESATLTAYAHAILGVADTIHDLQEMTDADVDELASDVKMPKLKVRKFKNALKALHGRKAMPLPEPVEYI